MLRCVKRKPSKGRTDTESPLCVRRALSESTEALPAATARPTRASMPKKSATLSGHTTQTHSDSRSSSKSKGPRVFNLSHWRTLSLSSLFSPSKRRKREESGMATSSGFVSPSNETEPLVGTSESISHSAHKRPQTITIHNLSHSELTSQDTGQSTPTGMINGHGDTSDTDIQDDKLHRMTEAALRDRNNSSDHTPTGSQPGAYCFPPTSIVSQNDLSDGDSNDEQLATPKYKTQFSEAGKKKEAFETHQSAHRKEGAEKHPSFLRAARAGNTPKVTELLNSQLDINGTNPNGLTALHLATKEGHLETVRVLLERDASVDLTTKKGNTALHIASLAGHKEIVQLLIEHGANVNCQSQNGFTPLYMAAQENHVEIVHQLLNSSANPGLSTEDGFTPLAVALQQGHERVVSVLLERDSRGKTRLSALHIAAKKNDVDAVRLLLSNKEVNVNHASASGFTPLHIAAHYGNVEVTKLLVERGANISYLAKNDITPMHVAAKWGRMGIVEYMLKTGAAVDARTRDGLSPLHCAARSGHAKVVQILLKAGADVNLKTRNDLSPLHMAAQGDHEVIVRLLLDSQANVDAVTVECLTPLHVAAHCGYLNVARVLLEYHCNANARALNGFTALHIACKRAQLAVVQLLIGNGAALEAATETGLTPLHVASFVGCQDVVSLLLKNGANLDQVTLRKETPLHLVARTGQVETAKILINSGSNINAETKDNQTPLHVAVVSRQFAIVQLLLQSGANAHLTTRDGNTALHLATKEDAEDIIRMLVKHGVSSDQKNNKGFTPLHLAVKHGKLTNAQILLHEAQADPNASSLNGYTPVHTAAYYNQSSILQLLVDNGGDVNGTVKNGFTAMHLAAKRNCIDCVRILFERGAAIDAPSRSGYTPLHLASQEGHLALVQLLINRCQSSANPAAADGLTPLHVAVQENKVSVAEYLLNSGASLHATTTEACFTPIHVAAFRGHLSALRLLLGRLPPSECVKAINARTRMGSTALHLAAQQGHLQLVLKLLQSGADANARNRGGWTPAQLAYKQHYMNLFETLRKVTTNVTDWSVPSLTGAGPDGLLDGDPSYVTGSVVMDRVENIADPVVSDSEDENGDQCHRTISYDVLYEQLEYMRGHLGERLETASIHALVNGELPQTTASKQKLPELMGTRDIKAPSAEFLTTGLSELEFFSEHTHVTRKPIKSGFLISFVVDARGCLVEAKRRSDLRFFIPPNALPSPVRIICRVLRPEFSPNYPNMNDGDCLATRILELSPFQMQFALPVLIEVPHIASLQDGEREIVVMRSETGTSWKEHPMEATDEAVHDALGEIFSHFDSATTLQQRRIQRILTYDFPQYFALISRFRQQIVLIGSEGGTIKSSVVPQVQAVFQPGSLQKRIKVGLQVHRIPLKCITRIAGSHVFASPVVSIEPRRRKFHKPITLTIPHPEPKSKGRLSQQGFVSQLRLLRSLSGGSSPAVWEDITEATELIRIKDCVSFTTTFSARFWLIHCPIAKAVVETTTSIYREGVIPPIIGRFAAFGRHPLNLQPAAESIGTTGQQHTSRFLPDTQDSTLVQLRCLCLTDDNEDKTLECLERYSLLAVGQPTVVHENCPYWIEVSGKLVPIMTGDNQPKIIVQSFHDNRVTFPVRLQESDRRESPANYVTGTLWFMREPSYSRSGEDSADYQREAPVATLEVRLPRPGHTVLVATTGAEILGRSELDRSTLAGQLGSDWKQLAPYLGISEDEIDAIQRTASVSATTSVAAEQEQADLLLRMWQQRVVDGEKTADDALGNQLADALEQINRLDVIHPSMKNVRPVVTSEERNLASLILDRRSHPPKPLEKKDAELREISKRTPEPSTTVSQPVLEETALDSSPLVDDRTDYEVSSLSASALDEEKRSPIAAISPESFASQSGVSVIAPLDQVEQSWDQFHDIEPSDVHLAPTDLAHPAALLSVDVVKQETVLEDRKVIAPVKLEDTGTLMGTDMAETAHEETFDFKPVTAYHDEEEPIRPIVTTELPSIPDVSTSPIVIRKMATDEMETGVPQLLHGPLEDEDAGFVQRQQIVSMPKVESGEPSLSPELEGPSEFKERRVESPIESVLESFKQPTETPPPFKEVSVVKARELIDQKKVVDAVPSMIPEFEKQLYIATVKQEAAQEEKIVTTAVLIAPEARAIVPEDTVAEVLIHRPTVTIPVVKEPLTIQVPPEPAIALDGAVTTALEEGTIKEPSVDVQVTLDSFAVSSREMMGAEEAPSEAELEPEYTQPYDEEAEDYMPVAEEMGLSSDEEAFEDAYFKAAQLETLHYEDGLAPSAEFLESAFPLISQSEPIHTEISSTPTTMLPFPVGSAGHDVIQSSPEESQSIEEVEEILPDGTVVRSRTATMETTTSVTSRDWEEGVDAALQSGAYAMESPEERTEVEEVEEVLPDGVVIRRLVTTKYVIDRVVENAVSDEIIGADGLPTVVPPSRPWDRAEGGSVPSYCVLRLRQS